MAFTADGVDLLINAICNYSGQVPLPRGNLLLTVRADGGWTITP